MTDTTGRCPPRPIVTACERLDVEQRLWANVDPSIAATVTEVENRHPGPTTVTSAESAVSITQGGDLPRRPRQRPGRTDARCACHLKRALRARGRT